MILSKTPWEMLSTSKRQKVTVKRNDWQTQKDEGENKRLGWTIKCYTSVNYLIIIKLVWSFLKQQRNSIGQKYCIKVMLSVWLLRNLTVNTWKEVKNFKFLTIYQQKAQIDIYAYVLIFACWMFIVFLKPFTKNQYMRINYSCKSPLFYFLKFLY